MKEKVIAIIPARGGSKGIPQKNIRCIAGKPLLTYSIEQALQTKSIERVIVSTDDEGIATLAKNSGAEVIIRPAELSTDKAISETALLHVLDTLHESEGYDPEIVVFLQATSPLRGPRDIQKALEKLLKENADSLFSARAIEGFIWSSKDSLAKPINYDPANRPTRQELPERFVEENGSIYIFKTDVLRKYQCRLGGKIALYQMDPLSSFQVDEPADLEFMEKLMGLRESRGELPDLGGIELLALDFDGVMTDNTVQVDQEGKETVCCHRGDGWGIARLKERGLKVIVFSTEKNPVVAARCHKLGIECVQGLDDKLSSLQETASQQGLEPERIAYVGNDVNDIECMRWVGVPIAVADAVEEIKAVAKYVAKQQGGRGAVREVAELVLEAKRMNK